MTYQDSAEKAAKVFKLVIPLMTQHRVPVTPPNYSVWYDYVTGRNKDLIMEIDRVIQQKLPFDTAKNDELFTEFVAARAERQTLQDTSTRATRLLDEMAMLMTDVGDENKQYGAEVAAHAEKLTEAQDPGKMKDLMRELLEGAKRLREKSEQMDQRLASSRDEVEQLRRDMDKITKEAERDFLTGVSNRKSFDKALTRQLAASQESGVPFCLLMADVDHFKQYNDNWGHLLGDEVLKVVAKSMVDSVKGKDVVSRFGGEEFAVILPNTPLQGGLVVAEQIRDTIAGSDLRRRDTGAMCGNVTISIGVAAFRKGDTPESIIKRADKALYRSKADGRNRVSREEAA
ncbi:MAG: diguanylate cyclase [Alphaproteobacteria bacterium]|nr:diguanylate cyclase [Alphaproteobacteria bacterium]